MKQASDRMKKIEAEKDARMKEQFETRMKEELERKRRDEAQKLQEKLWVGRIPERVEDRKEKTKQSRANQIRTEKRREEKIK